MFAVPSCLPQCHHFSVDKGVPGSVSLAQQLRFHEHLLYLLSPVMRIPPCQIFHSQIPGWCWGIFLLAGMKWSAMLWKLYPWGGCERAKLGRKYYCCCSCHLWTTAGEFCLPDYPSEDYKTFKIMLFLFISFPKWAPEFLLALWMKILGWSTAGVVLAAGLGFRPERFDFVGDLVPP